jgi:hypothetical protein
MRFPNLTHYILGKNKFVDLKFRLIFSNFKIQKREGKETMYISSSGFKLLFICLLVLLVPASRAFATDTTVGCPGGTPGAFTTMSDALASLSAVGPNSIAVSGTCTENVFVINRTDLSIFGNPTATIQPATPTGRPLFISGSQRISVSNNITFNGGRGIFINSSTDVTFDSVTVQNGSGIGVTAIDSLSHISNSTINNNARSGISVGGGTFYLDSGVNVTNNGRTGVSALTAHLILNGGDGTPGTANVISHNGLVGVALFNTSESDINGDNQITFNGSVGLEVVHTSTVLMSDGIINNNTGIGVHCGETSHCEFSGTTNINSNAAGGVEITDHSDAYLDGGIVISGNTGVGLLIDLSSVLNSLGGNTINNNTGDAVVLNTLSVIKFALPDTITPTTGNLALNCNNGSLVTGDLSPYKPKKCGLAFQTIPIH